MDHILWEIGHELKLENITRARGSSVFDSSGREYTDLESGVWCTPLGHCHPRVNQALKRQMDDILHTGYCYAHPIIRETAGAVLDICGMESGRCLFLTSGSEAVEVGVKALQLTGSNSLLMTFADSFLGSLGSSAGKPDEEWFLFDWEGCHDCRRREPCDTGCDRYETIPFEKIAGFVFEPGSSSGMVRFPPEKLVTAITDTIHEAGGFIQVNEITTGIGRTGLWFGFQHYGIKPDIVSVGKGLGNGYPVSATVFNDSILPVMEKHNFYHSQSHQNDPLGCAAALSVITVLKKDGLIETAREKGEHLITALTGLAQKHSLVREIRGRGLMIALEFKADVPHKTIIRIHQALIEKGFIVAKRPHISTFRIDPPLTIDSQILDNFVRTLDEILSTV